MSYAKNHLLQFQNTPESTLSTSTLMETYVKSPMRPTPTLIFLTPTGEVIYELPGYIPSNEILALLEYFLFNENGSFAYGYICHSLCHSNIY